MQRKTGLRIFGLLILTALLAPAVVRSQTPATSQAPQTTAIRAGRLFDPKSGTNLMNQVVIIKGDRVSDVGPADRVQIPPDAKVIDLSRATVLPGLIDGHVHLTDASVGLQHQMMVALYSATQSLNAGYTTLVPMGSHGGGYADVELRNAIDAGFVHGPRILPAGPLIEITSPGKTTFPLDWKPFEPSIYADGPGQFREAVRQLAHYGADHIKIMTTGAFSFKPGTGEMVNQELPTLDEVKAAVEEAHRLGLFVASHTYGGPGLKHAIEVGEEDIQHGLAADDEDIKMLVQKNLPITSTILDQRQDEPGDLKRFAPYSRWRIQQVTWKKMMTAGVRLGFGSGAAPVTNGQGRIYNLACQCSHGVQGEMFPVFVSWGATPVYTLRMATMVNAEIIHQQNNLGSIEKGKFADIIAVSGDPLQDISEMQRVKFVMRGGEVFRDELTALGNGALRTAK